MSTDVQAGCDFYQIAQGTLSKRIVYRTKGFVAIEDIDPRPEDHLLILPTHHIIPSAISRSFRPKI